MIRLLTAVLLFASLNAVAEVTLTPLSNNTPADADDVMGNFNALKQGVEANATALQGLIEPNQLCGTGFSCLSGTYDYRYGSDAEAEWWGRPNANSNCAFGATGAFLYLLDSKWVLGTGLGGSTGVIATCNAATFVNHPTECGSNWEDANGPIEASFSSGSCGDQKLSDLNCGHDEIIKREGSAWVCAADPFAGLNCDVGDQLRMGSGGWECRAEPITARLTQDSWDVSVEYAPISTYFDTYLNIDPDLYCNHAAGIAACAIRVLGVSDHNSCIAEVYGGATEGLNASVDISVDGGSSNLYVGTTWTWYSGEPVSIDIICAP